MPDRRWTIRSCGNYLRIPLRLLGFLGVDSVFAAELAAKRDRLMPTTIGKDGRIMEWLEPYEEVEPTHRHVSHLYGLYPGMRSR